MKNIKNFAVACLSSLSFLAFPAFAEEPLKIQFPVEKFILKNGLTVLLASDHRVPLVSYQTWYKVGSRNESPGVTGAAHMLEHMMFKGSKNYSETEFKKFFQKNGITYNAFTTQDYTGFFETLPSHLLTEMMKIEVDRMSQLRVLKDSLNSELQVVGEERRMRVENNPQAFAYEAFFELIFTQANYRWPIIGWMKDIQAYNPEKLNFFHQNFYLPNNAVLVLAGDFDLKETRAQIEKYYSAIPAGAIFNTADVTEPEPMKSLEIQVKKNIQSPSLIMGYKTVALDHPDSDAFEVLEEVLGGSSSSRLHKVLVLKKQIALSASGFQTGLKKEGVFGFFVTLKPSSEDLGTSQKAKALILKEVAQLQKNAISARELQKVKNSYLKGFVDSLQTFEGRARLLASSEILYGDYQHLYQQILKINAVTPIQVQKVCQKYLRPERLRTVYLLPEVTAMATSARIQ